MNTYTHMMISCRGGWEGLSEDEKNTILCPLSPTPTLRTLLGIMAGLYIPAQNRAFRNMSAHQKILEHQKVLQPASQAIDAGVVVALWNNKPVRLDDTLSYTSERNTIAFLRA